ncbi:hypothetical protein [Halostella litorea]|uniref:hypothetical protein n=1 Tax=Halostella litorea TaxID=2528831 RepID=UPI0010923BA5|nr:hypothetical protein [Halostella litorea]
MVPRPLRRTVPASDSPAVSAYGPVFALLVASLLLQRFLPAVVRTVVDRLSAVAGPQAVGAAVYAVLATAAYVAVAGHWGRGVEWDALLSVGGTTALVGFAGAYRLLGAAALPAFPDDAVSALLVGGVAMGALGVGYARLRGVGVRFTGPARDALPVAGAVGLVAAVACLGWVAALAARGNAVFLGPVGGVFGPRRSAAALLADAALPAALVGSGTAVLYNGAVQADLRGRVGPNGAVAAVTALVGLGAVQIRVGGRADPVATAATVGAVALAAVFCAFVAARAAAAGPLDADRPAVAAAVGVVVVALVLGAVASVRPADGLFVAYGLALTVVAAAAGVGYERTRSVWVPALAFALQRLLTDAGVALALASAVG